MVMCLIMCTFARFLSEINEIYKLHKATPNVIMNPIKKTITLADGRQITLETGKLAKQADGNTMLLATVVSAKEAGEGVDFMPLQVEYKEKFSAAGRFPGGFLKREGRANDYEILTSRLVDRVLRPLFPDNYHADTFVNIIMFSSDGVDMPDALAGLAASAALAVSDIPFNGPISEVRVARINGEFVIDPTFEQLEQADMELMVGATYDNIMMVEGEMNEVSEADLLAALKAAHAAICPGHGAHALKAAGEAIANIPCGYIGDNTVMNVGTLKCEGKTNVVPALAEFDMEVRSFIKEELEAHISACEETLKKACEHYGTSYVFDVDRQCDVLYVNENSDTMLELLNAYRELGHEPTISRTYGGSDATWLFAHGIDAINIGTGMEDVHGLSEHINIENMVTTAELVFKLMCRQ